MSYTYCYLIVKNGKAIKEIYSKNGSDKICYRWTTKNYEALPFLTIPDPLPENAQPVSLFLQTFYYIEEEDGILTLKETLPKPYGRPNEFESIPAAKKEFKRNLVYNKELKQQSITDLENQIKHFEHLLAVVDFLELERD